jgi:recombination protein RecR
MFPEKMQKVIEWFGSLPGIGHKSAERIAFYLLGLPPEKIKSFSEDMLSMNRGVKACSACGNYADSDLCGICGDESRDPSVLCVVESPKDVIVFEKSSQYRGRYHVLGGKLSPLDGIGPDELNITRLRERVEKESVKELIIATGADLEGEATADYIAGLFKEGGLKVSRIAFGIPFGSNLDFANSATIEKALKYRVDISKDKKN